ncbi:hypothetical protein DTO217A2_1872 [Paecilomyces variotii]|nr:hypothetical protein DTO217A2_1872 [Paecilomyces variotii]KAJ9373135.1 hypothetical protein DTO282E5_2202 [Paecilomyces variotii]KAJ9396208.1 hypothetical protein DTO282F9_6912 [Paecilomyces variotii]
MSVQRNGRNVFIEFASAPGVIRGGICAAPNLTTAQFLVLLNHLFKARAGGFSTRLKGSNTHLLPTTQAIQHGVYILTPVTPGDQILISDTQYHRRADPALGTPREQAFSTQVRQRDRRCVITHTPVLSADVDMWEGFQASHIFPRNLEKLFVDLGYANLVTHSHPKGVNSPQNGILLKNDVHTLYHRYALSINPDDEYRVYSFRPNAYQYHGLILDTVCRQPNDSRAVHPELLRWHFEHAVLSNMRGAGEPLWEFDFPPGADMMGEIRRGPLPELRMETELFARLGSYDGAASEDDLDGDTK